MKLCNFGVKNKNGFAEITSVEKALTVKPNHDPML